MPSRLFDRDDQAQIARRRRRPDSGSSRSGGARTISPRSGSPRRALDVGHQREPVEPRVWAPQPQALHDHGGPPVGGDDAAERRSRSAAAPCPLRPDGLGDDAGDPRALAEEIDHAHPLSDGDADLPGALHERRDPASGGARRERCGAIRGAGMVERVVTDEKRAVGPEDAHAPEWPGPPRLHPGENARDDPGSGCPPARGIRRRSCRGGNARGRGGRPTAPLAREGSPSRRPAGPAPTTTASARMAGSDGSGRVQTPTWRNAGPAASECPAARRARPGASAPPACTPAAPKAARRGGPSAARRSRGSRARLRPTRTDPGRKSLTTKPSRDELGELAEQRDDRILGEVMEDQRAERHVHRAGPDRSARARSPATMRTSGVPPAALRGVSPRSSGCISRAVMRTRRPRRRAHRARAIGMSAAPVPTSRIRSVSPGREPGEERRDVTQDGLRGADSVQPRDVGEVPGQLGGGRVELVHELAARGPLGSAGSASATRSGAERPRRRSRGRAPS